MCFDRISYKPYVECKMPCVFELLPYEGTGEIQFLLEQSGTMIQQNHQAPGKSSDVASGYSQGPGH